MFILIFSLYLIYCLYKYLTKKIPIGEIAQKLLNHLDNLIYYKIDNYKEYEYSCVLVVTNKLFFHYNNLSKKLIIYHNNYNYSSFTETILNIDENDKKSKLLFDNNKQSLDLINLNKEEMFQIISKINDIVCIKNNQSKIDKINLI